MDAYLGVCLRELPFDRAGKARRVKLSRFEIYSLSGAKLQRLEADRGRDGCLPRTVLN